MPRCFEQPELRLKLPFAAIKYSEADTGGSDPESVSIYLFFIYVFAALLSNY